MALSTPASATRLAAGLRPPSGLPPAGERGASPRSSEAGGTLEAARSSSLGRDAFRRLLKNRLAVAGGVVVILLCLIAIFADFLAPYSYTKTNFGRLNETPTRDYPFGTDNLGRDMLSRMIYGARVSMLVGLGA